MVERSLLGVLWVVMLSMGGCSNTPSQDPARSAHGTDTPGEGSPAQKGGATAENGSGSAMKEGSPVEKDLDPSSAFPFTEVAKASGIDFVHYNGAAGRHYYVETMSPGVALFDADGDGDLDLYLVNGAPLPGSPSGDNPQNRFFLNRGDGTFEDVTESSGSGDTGYGNGCAVGDYDGDGDLDLYVLNYGPNALYRSDGRGHFQRVEVGAEDPAWSISAAFLDYDEDGDQDLYVVNYLKYDVETEKACKTDDLEIYCSPELYPPAPDRLYRNQDGRFSDVSSQSGVGRGGRGMGIAVSDLDDDGDQDIYVANDRSENHLYRDEGKGFTEVGVEAGVGFGLTGRTEGGMGAIAGDFTGDGTMAIFHTNFQKEPNRFYVDAGGGFFDDRSFPSGLGLPSLEMVSWGIAAIDVEGDSDLDLAVGNGHVWENVSEFIPGTDYSQPDQLFFNDGQGGFETKVFPGPALSSRGIASGDLDGDGDPDLVIASCGGRVRVWRNDMGQPERFLLLQLAGRAPNTTAYGARVIARIGSRTLRREVYDGGSYASHSDTRIYLGLDDADDVDEIEIRWPDGSVEKESDVAGGQSVVWRQGEGIVSRRPLVAGTGQ